MHQHPKHWETITLGSAGDWFSGGTPKKSEADFWGGDIPWISAKSLKEFFVRDSGDKVTELGSRSGTRVIPENSILMLVRGMSLKTEFRMGITSCMSSTFNQDIKAIVPSKNFSPLFLAYAIRSRTPDILGMVDEAGHGTGRLQTDRLASLEIAYPPINEQIAIASVLKELDDKIELNRQMNHTLEAMAQAIFKSWFVDYDPVTAKAEGRQPYGMNAEIATLFPSHFVESELGPIPEGWEVSSIADLSRYVNGKNFTKNATGTGKMVIRIAELNSGPGASTVYNEIEANEDNTASPGDLLFSWSGSLDVYRWHKDEALVNQHIFKVIPQGFPQWFVYYQLREAISFFQGIAADKATTMGHIKREHLSQAKLLLPSAELIAAMDGVVKPMYQRIHQNERESITLASIRDSLLPRLLSGEIRVMQAEQKVVETA